MHCRKKLVSWSKRPVSAVCKARDCSVWLRLLQCGRGRKRCEPAVDILLGARCTFCTDPLSVFSIGLSSSCLRVGVVFHDDDDYSPLFRFTLKLFFKTTGRAFTTVVLNRCVVVPRRVHGEYSESTMQSECEATCPSFFCQYHESVRV